LQQEQRHDHRFLNAFATLLAREDETVAVATKNPSTPDSPTLEIVICCDDGCDRTSPITVGHPSGLPSSSFYSLAYRRRTDHVVRSSRT
jgi:hypothetical protein